MSLLKAEFNNNLNHDYNFSCYCKRKDQNNHIFHHDFSKHRAKFPLQKFSSNYKNEGSQESLTSQTMHAGKSASMQIMFLSMIDFNHIYPVQDDCREIEVLYFKHVC